jgi:GNAT superfamily N-acetyltransferase
VPSVERLDRDDLPRVIATIERSEHVEVEYAVENGRLVERPVTMTEVPDWDPIGDGPFSVADKVRFCESVVDDHGGVVLAALDDDTIAGAAAVAPSFEPPLAWFAFLHVTRPLRRRGAAGALWTASVDLARASGATQLYVSATPTGSAVGFYLSRGCRLAAPVHPTLFELEPDDIHLIIDL